MNVFKNYPPSRNASDFPSDAEPIGVQVLVEAQKRTAFRHPPLQLEFSPVLYTDWLQVWSPSFPAVRRQAPGHSPAYRDITWFEFSLRIRRGARCLLESMGLTLDQAYHQRTPGPDGKLSTAVLGMFANVDTLDYFTMGTLFIVSLSCCSLVLTVLMKIVSHDSQRCPSCRAR